MKFLSLFAGIGGFDLGLERAGMTCVGQVEIDPFCIAVLQKHWPLIRRFKDIRDVSKNDFAGEIDVLCGGFPCQGISSANYRGKGLKDERSGLWTEFHRLICELRPRFAIMENVSALVFRGLGTVLSDLSASGFDAEWQIVSAQMLGAPHERDRIFIVAYPAGVRLEADEIFNRRPPQAASEKQAARLRGWPGQRQHSPALPDRVRWCPDSRLCRVADGLPDQLDRYRAIGNSIVPQVAEWIGRAITEYESNVNTKDSLPDGPNAKAVTG